jgi:hypothetical protein
MIETIASGKPVTPFMRFGDTVRIEMKDARAIRSSAPSSKQLKKLRTDQ